MAWSSLALTLVLAAVDASVEGQVDGGVAEVSASFTTVVKAKSEGPPAVAAGDVRLELGLLADRPRRSGTDVLLLAPTVLQTQHGGEGHAPTLYVRGIDSGEGKDLELRVDGVPLNDVSNAHSHGYADTYFLIPELITTLRITEGPFHAGQGDFAVAGSAEFELGLPQRGVIVLGEYGAFNHSRLTALWGPEGQSGRSFVGLTLRQGSGFGPNRAFANGSLLASHELRLSDDVRVRLLLGLSGGRFDQSGVLREDEAEALSNPRCDAAPDAQFFCFNDPNQGGAQQRHFVSARLTQRLERGSLQHQLFAIARDQRLRENFTGFVTDVNASALGLSQRGDGLELLSGGLTVGARGSWQRRFVDEGFFQGAQLELGYFGRFDDLTARSRRLRAVDGAPYLTVFDNQLRVSNVALYAQGTLPLGARVTLRGGVRADAFLFAVADLNRPMVDRVGGRLADDRIEAFGIMPAPRAAIEVQLVPGLAWTTAAGLGARSTDGAALSDAEFAPFGVVVSTETGLAYRRQVESLRLEGRAAAFVTRVERDIVFSPEQGRNETVGASNRLGAFGLTRVTWGERLDVLATLSYTRGHLPPGGTPWYAVLDGPALPYVPRLLSRIDVVGRHAMTHLGQRFELSATAGMQVIGARPLPLGRLSESVLLFDASARVTWRWLSLGVVVDNLLDARWRQAEFNFASRFGDPDVAPSRLATRHFVAGPPRQWRVTLGLHFD